MDDHMEERLVEALGYHVQDSVNQALINALKPFAQPLRRFKQRELRSRPLLDAGSQPDQLSDLGSSQETLKRPLSSADILANMAASVMQDHGYDVYSSWDMYRKQRSLITFESGSSGPVMIIRSPDLAFYDRCDSAQFYAVRWEKVQKCPVGL
ncbi:hypothetical protein NDU88_007907 [Pleurodeles waltl]|uniref:Uncharacterized protein n=1 Tax=Pleurodeles waltl TaxID=8319 RepID=A0AAV7VTN3_PLEWA|nr:hypothetical protein NDU88_007907 [Pleurodeles waltl]